MAQTIPGFGWFSLYQCSSLAHHLQLAQADSHKRKLKAKARSSHVVALLSVSLQLTRIFFTDGATFEIIHYRFKFLSKMLSSKWHFR